MQRMDLRLKEVEKGNSSTSVSNKGGQNDASQVIDMMTRENLYAEEEYDDGVGMFVPRGSRGRGFGRGIGAGRGRGRMQESYNVAKNRGNDDYADRGLGNIKLKIPIFQGKSDPEAYMQWEKRVELIFDCHQCSEDKKVKLAITQFQDYAISW